jgi:hypothetical protein
VLEPEAAMDRQISATTTHSVTLEGLDRKSLNEIEEPIDPRIDSLSRPSPDELDVSLTRQISSLVQRVASRPSQHDDSTVESPIEKLEEPIYVSHSALLSFPRH